MNSFWTGFLKRASETPGNTGASDVLENWMTQSDQAEEEAARQKEPLKVDPRELSEWTSHNPYGYDRGP